MSQNFLAEDITFSKRILEVALRPFSGNTVKISCMKGLNRKVIYIAVPLYFKICNQFKAIMALCHYNLAHEAEILNRSVFESMLALFFLLKWRVVLKENGRKLNSPDKLTTKFRAELYFAHLIFEQERLLKDFERTPGLKRDSKTFNKSAIEEQVIQAKQIIGSYWTKRLRDKKKYAGVSIKDLAGSLNILKAYASMYRFTSWSVHAVDILNYLSSDQKNDEIVIDRRTTDYDVRRPLQTACFTFLLCIDKISGRLGFELEPDLLPLFEEVKNLK